MQGSMKSKKSQASTAVYSKTYLVGILWKKTETRKWLTVMKWQPVAHLKKRINDNYCIHNEI